MGARRALLYGANGYTGRLILRECAAAGVPVHVAGRDRESIEALGRESGVEARVFELHDTAALERALGEVDAVIHAAGPFSRTAEPMMEACLRTGRHYTDITGEIPVFEAAAARGERARAAGVMLLPGVGFDVVPSDSLAAHLKRRLPTATELTLAFEGLGGGISRGTATTMVENLGRGGAVRRDGRIRRVPAAWRTREVDFGDGPVTVTTIPWGDVSTAYHSTGIPNVEVYTRVPRAQRRLLVATRRLGWLLGAAPVQRALKWGVRRGAPGPGETARRAGRARLWGEARDPQGRRAAARMVTGEPYALTATLAAAIMRRILSGDAPPGYQTPSTAYGPDWVLDIPGVAREDEEE